MIPHGPRWSANFTAAKPFELLTQDYHSDVSLQNWWRWTEGCIAVDPTANKESIGRGGAAGTSCSTLGYGMDSLARYLSLHGEADTSQNVAYNWKNYPKRAQPVGMRLTSGSTNIAFDLISVTVKYGSVDIWTSLNGSALTKSASSLAAGERRVAIWSVDYVEFRAAGAGSGVTSVNPAAIENIVVGQP
jgi:hypothetical protein